MPKCIRHQRNDVLEDHMRVLLWLSVLIIVQAALVIHQFFFLKDPPPTEFSPLPLHAPLPTPRARKRPAPVTAGEGSISSHEGPSGCGKEKDTGVTARKQAIETLRTLRQARSRDTPRARRRSEEHTSELQSQSNLVCRLLLEHK